MVITPWGSENAFHLLPEVVLRLSRVDSSLDAIDFVTEKNDSLLLLWREPGNDSFSVVDWAYFHLDRIADLLNRLSCLF